ncbi:SDR family oxidoreductase [soil metagenome]
MQKHLIITGASKGIGYATANHFLAQGWQVSNLSIKTCGLVGVKNYHVDLGMVETINRCKSELVSTLQSAAQICLVHNAAGYVQDNVLDLQQEKLRQMFEINVVAPTLLNQILLPMMPTGSSIVYIGSTLAEKAIKNSASYVVTKHAMAGLMKATCQDLFAKNIHTCCVCPGFTNTEMLQARFIEEPQAETFITNHIAFGRLIEPSEIANFIFYCANNPIVNGSMLHVNLGQREY